MISAHAGGAGSLVDGDDSVSVYSTYSTASSVAPGKRKTKKKKPVASAKPKEPSKPAFTALSVHNGLSQLGKTADGLKSAYLRLEVRGTSMANLDGLVHLPDLQTLVLPDNDLVDLSKLQQLPSLTSLNVQGNQLSHVLKFEVPEGGSNLRTANFARNQVRLMSDLSRFSHLRSLNLDNNPLESLTGLGRLPMLSSLSVAGNKLTSLQGLEKLPALRHLNAEDNQLRSLTAVSVLTTLESLLLARNNITNITALSKLVRLQQLDVSDNQLHSLHDLSPCSAASMLGELKVKGNPLCVSMSCRLHTVYLLPQVSVLDDLPVSAQEKVLSANMHGADADDLRRIRRIFFPNGELDDGGGAIPPPSAGLIASSAEEEIADLPAVTAAFLRIDAWARSVPVPRSTTAFPTTGLHLDNSEELSLGHQESLAPEASEVRISSPRQAGAVLLALAAHLGSTCGGNQLQLARVCLEWVASHLAPPPDGPGSVSAPLFEEPALASASGVGGGTPVPEKLLIRGQKGTWAERAATLFILIAKACELEAVIIPGYCKSLGLTPGETITAHNHCWAAVKVNGKWRLVDPAMSALKGGSSSSPSAPFYVPPQAWIYTYFPLEAHWQLLPDPIALDSWWALPHLSVGFFARGMKLQAPEGFAAVNTLPAPKEGGQFPVLELCVAAPISPATRLTHTLRHAATGKVVASWSRPTGTDAPPSPSAGGAASVAPALAYQQVEHDKASRVMVQFGASTFGSNTHRFVTSMTAPGEYLLEVHHVSQLPGGMPVQLAGLQAPLVLRIEESDVVLQGRVVVPEVEPHEPEEGLLHSPHVTVCPQPAIHPQFVHLRAQLVSPPAGTWLEADRTYEFVLLAPSGTQLMVSAQDGFSQPLLPAGSSTPGSDDTTTTTAAPLRPVCTPPVPTPPQQPAEQGSTRPRSRPTSSNISHQQQQQQQQQLVRYQALVQVPRAQQVHVTTLTSLPDLGVCGWLPMLTFPVAPQSQHIVDLYHEPDIPHVQMDDPAAAHLVESFHIMDANKDGKVTRAELIRGARQSKHVADLLKLPPTVAAHDGTLDRLIDRFLAVDTSKLGLFSFSELCLHLGVKPSEVAVSEEEEEDGDEEEEGEGGEEQEGEEAEGDY